MRYNSKIGTASRLVALGSALSLLGMSASAQAADITTGLVGHWDFEEGTGTTSTADTATSGSISDTAAFNGSPTYATGRVGYYALDLTSSNSTYLKIPASTDLAITGAYTISGWFNLANLPTDPQAANPALFNTRNGSPDSNFDLQIVKKNAGQPNAAWTGVHGDIGYGNSWLNTNVNYSQTLTPGNWYMVTYAVQDDEARIFIDGGKVATITWSNTNAPKLMASNSNLYIGLGVGSIGTGNHLPGSVDDVRIYNRSLPDAEVAALYTASVPAPEPGSVGLLMGLGGLALMKRRKQVVT